MRAYKRPWPKMRDCVRATPHPDESLLLKYLEAAACVLASGAFRYDCLRLQGEPYHIGGFSLMTDGQWFWLDELRYYVRVYHLALPCEFVEHARCHQWIAKTPTREESQLAQLCWQYHRPSIPWYRLIRPLPLATIDTACFTTQQPQLLFTLRTPPCSC